MYKTLLVLLMLFCCATSRLLGQTFIDEAYKDSITYQYYLQGNWKAVLKTGNEMIGQGSDYYFLRMRMGIAQMELGQPVKAEKHFRKALALNPADENAQVYLRSALQAELKTLEAGSVLAQMNPTLRRQLGYSTKFQPVSAHFDMGFVDRGSFKGLDYISLTGGHKLFGQEHFYNNNWFSDGGFYFQTKPQWLFYIGMQHIRIDAVDRFAYYDSGLKRDSIVNNSFGNAYYYSLDTLQKVSNYSHLLRQNALYFQAHWSGNSRWSLVAAAQWARVKRDFTIADIQTVSLHDTAFYNPAEAVVDYFESDLSQIVFTELTWQTNDYSLALHGRYHFGVVSATGGFTKAKVNDTSILQYNLGYQWMPFGNARFTQQAEMLYLVSTKGNQLAGRFSLSWWPNPKWLVGADWLVGTLNNMSEQYSYIVYNNPEQVYSRLETSVSWMVGQHLQLQLRFRQLKSNRRYDFFSNTTDGLATQYYHTQSNTFIGGIKWIF